LRTFLYSVAVLGLVVIGLYALLLVFTAATPAIFGLALVVLAAVVVGIIYLRRHRPVAG
jgi:hypothetical protein